MNDSLQSILKERLNLRLTIASILIACSGISLLYASAAESLATNAPLSALLANLGSLLIVTGLITICWETIGKRAFADELLSLFAISRSSLESGVVQFSSSFQNRDIDWDSLFERTKSIDLMFMGSASWRNTHFLQIETFLQNPGASLSVVLPDPAHTGTLQACANRLNKTTYEVKQYLNDATKYFAELAQKHPSAEIQIWHLAQIPTFSIFKFDERILFALYSHQQKRVPVPTFVCHEPGKLFEYLSTELNAIKGNGDSASSGKKVYPKDD